MILGSLLTQKRTLVGAVILAALAVSIGPLGAFAKGGADNVVGAVAVPSYTIRTSSATFAGQTLNLAGAATIRNFNGKENEQWVKFSWGDGTTDTVSAATLPTYTKSSKTLTIPLWTKSHVYAAPVSSYAVTLTVYRGDNKGAQLYPAESAQYTLVTENTKALCSDGIDNDKDWYPDFADADCAPFKEAETTLALCSDGVDNDYNGFTDLRDPSCAAFIPPENTEETCSDGIDNNVNGYTDLADESCKEFRPAEDTLELCTDGIDNDYDGLRDGQDPMCIPLLPTEDTFETCNDGIDNDYDGLADRMEPSCAPFVMFFPW